MAHKVPATKFTGTLASNVTECKATQYSWSVSYKSIKEYPSASVQTYGFPCSLLQLHFKLNVSSANIGFPLQF